MTNRSRIAEGRRGQGGFTLVELLVAMALLGIVLTLLLQVFLTSNKSQETVEHSAQSTVSAETLVVNLASDVRDSAARRTAVDRMDVQFVDGTCASWWVEDGGLYSAKGNKAAAYGTSKKALLVEGVSVPAGEAGFFGSNAGSVRYSIDYTTGGPTVTLKGEVFARNQTPATITCW